MDIRVISQVGISDTLTVLEPAKKCACHCTWCYVELNSKFRAGRRGVAADAAKARPSAFARTVNRAFGPDYDPADFLQFTLREKLPLTWASGVEPWQDAEQAVATFDVIDRLDLPVLIQTRGTNWRSAWDGVGRRAAAGQVALFASLPSTSPGYYKRYEPGTPAFDDRVEMIRAACDLGVPVMLAVAPYHPTWSDDVADLARLAVESWGVRGVFFDPLHLNHDQLSVAGDATLRDLVRTAWTDDGIARLADAKAACVANDRTWYTPTWKAPLSRLESYKPLGWAPYARSTPFGYLDDAVFDAVHPLIDADDSPPLVVTWDAALAIMERAGRIGQAFSYASLGSVAIGPYTRAGKHPAGDVLESLRRGAPISSYLNAYWNTPRGAGFFWRHPFVRQAVRADGTPHLDPSGNAVAIFDPSYGPRQMARVVDDLSAHRTLKLAIP